MTPAILPNFENWKPPALPFSWRTVLRREYTALFIVTTMFPLLEVIGDSLVEKRIQVDRPWLVIAVLGASAYLLLRFFKKHTDWLTEEGR